MQYILSTFCAFRYFLFLLNYFKLIVLGVDTRVSSFDENYSTIKNELFFQNNQMEMKETTDSKNSFSLMSPSSIPFSLSESKNYLLTNTFPPNISSNSYNDFSCDPVSLHSYNENEKLTKLYKNSSIVIIADCQTNTVKVFF